MLYLLLIALVCVPPAAVDDLDAVTRDALQSLPPLTLPPIDPALLQYGIDYRVAWGTGNISTIDTLTPTAHATLSDAFSTGYPGANCHVDSSCNTFCRKNGQPPGDYDACADQWYRHNAAQSGTLAADAQGLSLYLPLFGAAALNSFAERRLDAYGLHLEATVHAFVGHGQRHNTWELDGGMRVANAFYRRYLTVSTDMPYYWEAAWNQDNATVWLSKTTGQPQYNAYRVPLRAVLSVGAGRLYTIEPRLRLAKLEKLFLDQGLIHKPLEPEIGRLIMLTWWALRDELGYRQRLVYTLKALLDAGVLHGDINQETVYQFGRIFTDTELVTRQQGHDTRLSWRLARAWQNTFAPLGLDPEAFTMLFELRHRLVFNLSYATELSLAARLAWAPRALDRIDNTFLAADGASLGIDFARLSLSVPLRYRRFLYDPAYNRQGAWSAFARLGIGLGVPSLTDAGRTYSNAMLGVGTEFAWYRNRTTGYAVGVGLDGGYAYGTLGYVVTAQLRGEFGHAEAYYVAPVEDAAGGLPFDADFRE